MSVTLQNILVLSLVFACLAIVGMQTFTALKGRKSKLGSCCSKGCLNESSEASPDARKNERIVFLPVDMLGRKRP